MKLKMIILLSLLLIIAGCSPESQTQPAPKPEVQECELSGWSDTEWTYFSFEKGLVVGHSLFGDAAADREWKERADWDIAFCGEYIRTNGGTSGNACGVLQKVNDMSFNAIEQAPSDGYVEDGTDIIVRH